MPMLGRALPALPRILFVVLLCKKSNHDNERCQTPQHTTFNIFVVLFIKKSNQTQHFSVFVVLLVKKSNQTQHFSVFIVLLVKKSNHDHGLLEKVSNKTTN